MQLTVKEALAIYPLCEGTLVAGSEGTGRVVKSVNVMDAPDIADWIKTGEMLFTTAFVMKDNLGDAIHMLRKLNERGCAGLGIKLGRFWEKIPQDIIDEANRLHLPLFELPFQFTFSDQINALFKADYERNTISLQSIVAKQKKLMQFALLHENHHEAFAMLGEILERPIAVIGSRGHVLFQNGDLPREELTQGWPWKVIHHRVRWVHGSSYRFPIVQKDETHGFLVVYINTAIPVKAEEELFQQAADVLAYFMDKIYREPHHSTHHDELRHLMTQYLTRKITLDPLKERMEVLGMNLFEDSYQCVLTTLEQMPFSSNKVLKQIHQELQYNPWVHLGASYHLHTDEGILSIYACPSNRDYGDELSQFILNRFQDLLGGKGSDASTIPRFWISKSKSTPDSLRDAYQECIDTKQLAERFGMKMPVLQFETLEFAYVFQYVPDHVMSNFCNKILSPLLSKEGDSNLVLMNTLEAFIENDCLINEAAKQLYVHRNTVTYRMEKIGTLLHMDFKRVDDLLKLKMAFTFRKFMQNNNLLSYSVRA
ncbi:purine catabolism regulator [Paenibacillus sp. DS2015]|uniref:PucR family transcriptional regulator n=1 Tax=Paenibacillus sp. DS2015 TaxID=3373917 RepID=UPI003D21DD37